jgi:hypothetical protein
VINVLAIYSARGSTIIEKLLVLTSKKIFEVSRSGEVEKRYEIEVGELKNASCVGEYLYEFIKVEDKTNKLNIVSRSSNKNVYYCGLEA